MTASSECENLDAFLDKELGAVAAASFESHLRECVACRDAARQQHWIDALLRSVATNERESPPDTILESFRTSLARRRRHARLTACGLAAAAALIIAAGWTMLLNRQASGPAVPDVAQIAPLSQTREISDFELPRATFVSSSDTITVPLESTAADVTIVQLYPTIETERRWRRELALQITFTEPNGG